MKNKLFLLFLTLFGCDKINKSQRKESAIQILPSSISMKDRINIDLFFNLFQTTTLPCSTKIIKDAAYLMKPFDKNNAYLNTDNDSFRVRQAPQKVCFYHDVCNESPPYHLKKVYSDTVYFANQFYGAILLKKTDKFKTIICRSRTFSQDIYLLTYTQSGTLISGLKTDTDCVNKYAYLKRRSYIDENLNIFVSDFQSDHDSGCDEAGFKATYQYKIDEQGKIQKAFEKVALLKTVDNEAFTRF